MKLARIGVAGDERPVAVGDDGVLYDLSTVTDEIDGSFLASGGIERARAALAAGGLAVIAPEGVRYGSPVVRPGKVICIGLNYAAHAAESNMDPPAEPVIFFKASNTVVGPDDKVLVPRGSEKTDYEVELAIVIGAEGRYLESREAALDVIAGYAVSNDVSERAFQLERGGQWVKGKSCETFNPLGPWLVTPDEVGDPQDLGMRTWVNAELRQDGRTDDMIFDVAHIVQYVSQFMVLEPGDVINTGTPQGVAFGANEFSYLQAGDVMELEIEGLGRQRQELFQA
jgi:2-keto-4-pentenoate hydratase/2-oxohepta-3-ene-1,7-dioic acid hydratase in catechol pathway